MMDVDGQRKPCCEYTPSTGTYRGGFLLCLLGDNIYLSVFSPYGYGRRRFGRHVCKHPIVVRASTSWTAFIAAHTLVGLREKCAECPAEYRLRRLAEDGRGGKVTVGVAVIIREREGGGVGRRRGTGRGAVVVALKVVRLRRCGSYDTV